jgi:hypothetical protein
MSEFLNITLNQAFYLTEKVSLFGFLILCIEDIINYKDFKSNGIYSWKVLSARKNKNFSLILNNWIPIQILLLVTCLLTIFDFIEFKAISFFVITLYFIFFQKRNLYGFDGSEQMLQVIFLLLFFKSLSTNATFTLIIYYAFITQIFVSYFFSGYNKFKGKLWRNGTALNKILNTESFGNKKYSLILSKNLKLSKTLTYGTIIYQMIFPIIMIIPNYEIRLTYLGFGILFHTGIGLSMGLNIFIYSFLAIYPILLYFIQNG